MKSVPTFYLKMRPYKNISNRKLLQENVINLNFRLRMQNYGKTKLPNRKSIINYHATDAIGFTAY